MAKIENERPSVFELRLSVSVDPEISLYLLAVHFSQMIQLIFHQTQLVGHIFLHNREEKDTLIVLLFLSS